MKNKKIIIKLKSIITNLSNDLSNDEFKTIKNYL